MAQKGTTHIRIPIELKDQLNKIAEEEQRDQIVVLTRILTKGIALEKSSA